LTLKIFPFLQVNFLKGGFEEFSDNGELSNMGRMELLFSFTCHLLLLITVLYILNSLRTKIFHQSSDKAQTDDIGAIATASAIAIVLIISTFIAMGIVMAGPILAKYVASAYTYWRVLYIFV
jgi:hypothetical protein